MQTWNEINTQEDIDFFMKSTGCMHDSIIISIEYYTGCDVTADRKTLFSLESGYCMRLVAGSCWFGKIEMIFSGVKHFSTGKSGDMWECYLGFHTNLMGRTRDDRLIVWTDTGLFNPEIYGTKIELGNIDLRSPANTYIIADRLKWRFTDEKEAEKCLQKE